MENENINFKKKSFKKSEFITLFASIYEHSDWVIKNIIKNNFNVPNTIYKLKIKNRNLYCMNILLFKVDYLYQKLLTH